MFLPHPHGDSLKSVLLLLWHLKIRHDIHFSFLNRYLLWSCLPARVFLLKASPGHVLPMPTEQDLWSKVQTLLGARGAHPASPPATHFAFVFSSCSELLLCRAEPCLQAFVFVSSGCCNRRRLKQRIFISHKIKALAGLVSGEDALPRLQTATVSRGPHMVKRYIVSLVSLPLRALIPFTGASLLSPNYRPKVHL